MSAITIGQTRQWEGVTYTFILTSKTSNYSSHCAGCDEDFIGERNIWRVGDDYFECCKGCHDIIVAADQTQGVTRG